MCDHFASTMRIVLRIAASHSASHAFEAGDAHGRSNPRPSLSTVTTHSPGCRLRHQSGVVSRILTSTFASGSSLASAANVSSIHLPSMTGTAAKPSP